MRGPRLPALGRHGVLTQGGVGEPSIKILNMKRTIFLLLLLLPGCMLLAQSEGGICEELLSRLRASNADSPANRALRNALSGTSIQQLTQPARNVEAEDKTFSHKVESKGITDQKSSGRCWLFTGLNVLRAQMIGEQGLGEFQFSQNFCFFYDQLEKSNLFLEAMIETAGRPQEDQTVDWLFQNPLSDGGTFCGVMDIVSKYGLVPAEVMPESYSANNTSQMTSYLKLKLREFGLKLRKAAAEGETTEQLRARKEEMLETVYHMLSICLGEPPTEFEWTLTDASGKRVSRETYTPKSFYETYVRTDLKNSFVMLMNDPSRPFYQTYTIDYDRHTYDGAQWTYLNLPIEEIKPLCISSIKDSTMMYFSCDVGKFLNSKTGVLSLRNYDAEALFSTDFPMTKAERISSHASASSHAMTLMAVDLDEEGKPCKWMVENSWGSASGFNGFLIMTDEWFEEYMFRVVVDKKFVPDSLLKLLEQEPVKLPAWDPLFAGEE